jgi:hypothetical protein
VQLFLTALRQNATIVDRREALAKAARQQPALPFGGY